MSKEKARLPTGCHSLGRNALGENVINMLKVTILKVDAIYPNCPNIKVTFQD